MIFFANIGKSGDSSIKNFHQNEMKTKKIKKRCFFCQRRGAQAVKIFFQKPEGLDLDGQAERAKFACFFEFLKHQQRRPSKMKDAFVVLG